MNTYNVSAQLWDIQTSIEILETSISGAAIVFLRNYIQVQSITIPEPYNEPNIYSITVSFNNVPIIKEIECLSPIDTIPGIVLSEVKIIGIEQINNFELNPIKNEIENNLMSIKNNFLAQTDKEAEELRTLFITPGSGQAMVYQQKKLEAKKFIIDNNISFSEIPHIISESQISNKTPLEVAQSIIDLSNQWLMISAIIEQIRLSSKMKIKNSLTVEEAINSKPNWTPIKELIQ